MVRDYGTRAAPRGPRAGWIGGVSRAAMAVGVAGPILALAAIPTLIGLAANAPDPDDPVRAAAGVPCRAVSQAEFERGWRDPPRAFLYRGARFARRRGDADCAVLRAGPVGQSYPACRFDAPAALAVTVAGRSA